MSSYVVYDRVVLQTSIKTSFTTIPANTVCTIKNEPKLGSSLILKYGIEEESGNIRDLIFGAPETVVRKVKPEELQQCSYKDLVSKNYWIGNYFMVGPEADIKGLSYKMIGKIVNIDLARNEQDDLLTFEFEGNEYGFERKFVELFFEKYDEEFESMLGEEFISKNQPKNFFLPGARMFYGNEIVIINRILENDKVLIETMEHEEKELSKDDLTPILSVEGGFYDLKHEEVVPQNYTVGNALVAKEEISRHSLLNKLINPQDQVQVLELDGVNINAFEDVYTVMINNDEDVVTKVSYLDLKRFFDPIMKVENKEEVFDTSVFENNVPLNQDQEDNKEDEITITIHELSILGYNFKIDKVDDDKFYIDDQEKPFYFSKLDSLIRALQTLDKI
ncbi:gp579 [Bacillus phage G]|uniref:Gp579 n=1 Tax=Bacillus phage G TaxID=2884420 RepID=G3MAV9_9CAUD|nr:gp579 [Bacillus phage G]AEO93824.1 gp579 [Bacillus phage G]